MSKSSQCETERTIRSMAAEGKTQKAIQEALGVPRNTLRHMIEALGDVEFLGSAQSRGAAVFEVRGFKGTVEQIRKKFDLEITAGTVYWRMKRGQTAEEAFFTLPTGERFTYQGFSGTVYQIIRHFNLNISRDTVFKRIKRGKSLEEAFSIKQPSTAPRVDKVWRHKVYTLNGVTGSLAGLHAQFKPPLAVETIRRLVRSGMSVEEAFAEKRGKITVRGFTGFIPDIIRHFDLSIRNSTVFHRINYYGWDEDRAFFTPPDITRARYREYERSNHIPASAGSVHAAL